MLPVSVKFEVATANTIGLLEEPPTATSRLPVDAPEGIGTVMLESLQLVGVPATPLKVTPLLPCAAPKPEPVMVTDVPMGPPVGASAVIDGDA
jgi:hypothetical protein